MAKRLKDILEQKTSRALRKAEQRSAGNLNAHVDPDTGEKTSIPHQKRPETGWQSLSKVATATGSTSLKYRDGDRESSNVEDRRPATQYKSTGSAAKIQGVQGTQSGEKGVGDFDSERRGDDAYERVKDDPAFIKYAKSLATRSAEKIKLPKEISNLDPKLSSVRKYKDLPD